MVYLFFEYGHTRRKFVLLKVIETVEVQFVRVINILHKIFFQLVILLVLVEQLFIKFTAKSVPRAMKCFRRPSMLVILVLRTKFLKYKSSFIYVMEVSLSNRIAVAFCLKDFSMFNGIRFRRLFSAINIPPITSMCSIFSHFRSNPFLVDMVTFAMFSRSFLFSTVVNVLKHFLFIHPGFFLTLEITFPCFVLKRLIVKIFESLFHLFFIRT